MRQKLGSMVPCPICGEEYYRAKHDITHNRRKTCGKSACKTANMSGKNNPFYGKKHSAETRAKIKEGRKKNPPKGTGPKKGVFKHTEEAKKRIAAASRRMWAENYDKMLESLPRGEDHIFHKDPELRRHRLHFTPVQRRELTGTECAYCETTENLELDHIIPIFDGGTNDPSNAQTLCRGCNIWKTYFVDLPRYKAAKQQGG